MVHAKQWKANDKAVVRQWNELGNVGRTNELQHLMAEPRVENYGLGYPLVD